MLVLPLIRGWVEWEWVRKREREGWSKEGKGGGRERDP